METKKLGDRLTKAKPFLAVVFIQFGFAGMSVITKIIGALVIVSGLYMVLWGKSKDEIESPSDGGGSSHKVASAEADLQAIPVSMPGSIEVASRDARLQYNQHKGMSNLYVYVMLHA
ncbi:hypothetical protein SAY87_007864 [Trapa incisa]|uniref:WAT1-related protein n=1 Tax=Trapa incisa TaxID=236973 RepID=A0AAN7KNT2_9MYRT|nr:hypothetical protein SAY87_007864 [Trapa incisa]